MTDSEIEPIVLVLIVFAFLYLLEIMLIAGPYAELCWERCCKERPRGEICIDNP